jgi:hypothetical protein
VIKRRRVGWLGNVTQIEEVIIACTILAGKSREGPKVEICMVNLIM